LLYPSFNFSGFCALGSEAEAGKTYKELVNTIRQDIKEIILSRKEAQVHCVDREY